MRITLTALVLLATGSGAAFGTPLQVRAQDTTHAQDTTRLVIDTTHAGTGWNSPRVRDLVSRASLRRALPQADTALHNYKATAEGFVYFFLDRRDTDERTLVRVNQIGLELYWRQPGVARQRIAGMRDASPLPNTMRYHLDHLTMVQNGFGDIIRVGDGDEVSDVVHPASAAGPGVYEYRLADSLDLRLPSMQNSIRVYEVQVRPRRTDRPGFVGSMFIDRETADVIRMTFTFTPSSYVDKRLDYINLSLDNGLWEGRYWLPNEQTVEIRRQIPELDFVAGSVIRGRMRITDYELNAVVPDSIFLQGRAVVSAAPEELKNYAFKQGIFEDVKTEGLSETPETKHLREEAAQLIGARLLSGLPHLRLYYPDISSGIRYNRAEGLYLGTGVTYSTGVPWRLDASAGYAFGAERPSFLGRITYSPAAASLSLAGYTRALRDLGPVTPLAGVANSLSSMVLGRDYLDPWFATGASLTFDHPVGGAIHAVAGAAVEQQRKASLEESHAPFDSGAEFRAIRPIEPGTDYSAHIGLTRATPTRGAVAFGGSFTVRGAFINRSEDFNSEGLYFKSQLNGQLDLRDIAHARDAHISMAAAVMGDNAPLQQLFVIGGTGTLPGYQYRSFAGHTGALLGAEATQRVVYPWLGLRAVAAVGATGNTPPSLPTATWPGQSSDGLRASAGAGVSLFWDILHVDAVKGLNGGKWVLQLSFMRLLNDVS